MSVLGATTPSWEASWVYECLWGVGVNCLLCKCEALSLHSRTCVKLGGAAPTCAPITREHCGPRRQENSWELLGQVAYFIQH